MNQIFVAYEQLTGGDVPLAIFFDASSAHQFAQQENDAVQAELVAIQAISLIDNYGFHCQPRDLPLIAPWAAEPWVA